jgi:DNA-binding transcriptional LysR family regulator
MAALVAPPLVREIESSQARANLRVHPLTTRDPRRLLREGDGDLALGHFPDAVAAIVADGLQAREHHLRLYETHYVCVMRCEHPLSDRVLTLEDYCSAHHLLVSVSGRPHGLVDEALAALGRQRRVVLSVNQFFTAGQVIAQSDLLTVLPLSFLAATGATGHIVSRALPFELAPVALAMIWPVRLDADPAQRWLRALVRRVCGVDG